MPAAKRLKRATTIQQTVAASESYLDGASGSRKRKNPGSAAKASPKKAKLSKQQTMKATAKEGKSITKGKARARTRGKTAAKKPKLVKHSTMKATKVEGEQLVGKKKLASTRAKTKAKPAVKRMGTMQATAADSLNYLDDGNPYFSQVNSFVRANMAKK